MNNRSFLGGLLAVLLVGLLCICGLGLFFVAGGDAATAFLTPFQSGSGAAPQPLVEPVSEAESAPGETVVETARQPIEIPSDALAILRAEEEVISTLYQNVSPSVVNINIGGGDVNPAIGALGQGSGFVWDAEGHIVTNNHVVEQASSVSVTFADGLQLPGEVVGTDPNSDLAVIRVEAEPGYLQPLAVADSNELRPGQRVVAIGNPFGFEGTMTVGYISAIGRTVPGEVDPTGQGGFSMPNLIQTDAAINPGNSGGPLLDIEGRVIGVNTLIYSRTGANSGIGFAIPGNKVNTVVPALIETGQYETPYLGIESPQYGNALTPELAELLELENVTRGVLVGAVREGGPSEQAGLLGSNRQVQIPGIEQPVSTGGDVIVAVDEQPVQDFADVINYLDTKSVGDTITLTVIREGEELVLPVTLGARP